LGKESSVKKDGSIKVLLRRARKVRKIMIWNLG
jgi:hypothetical protein